MSSDLRLQTGDLEERGLNVEAGENLTHLWPPPLMEQVWNHQKKTGPRHLGTWEAEAEPRFPTSKVPLWPQFTATCLDAGCWAREFSSPQLPKPSLPKSEPAEGQDLLSELDMCRFVPKNLFIQQRITVPRTALPTRKLSSLLSQSRCLYMGTGPSSSNTIRDGSHKSQGPSSRS